jgi:hypothetical protein
MFAEHYWKTIVGISICQVTLADQCQLTLTFACSSFSRLQTALITQKRRELDDVGLCVQDTNSKPETAYEMVWLLPLGGATFHRFQLTVLFTTGKGANNSKTADAG